MKNWQLLLALQHALTPLCVASKGTLQVAKSLEHAREMLAKAPRHWTLILHLEGYQAHPNSTHGMTYYRVATVIQQLEGMQINPGNAVHNSLAGDVPFLERVEEVSAWMRSFKFPSNINVAPEGFTLEEGDWVETTERTLAQSLSWQLEASLPAFTTNRNLTIPT